MGFLDPPQKPIISVTQNSLRGLRALRSKVPLQHDPENTPVISISAGQPGSTPTFINSIASNAPNTKNFSFIGGPYKQYGSVFPEYNIVSDFQRQITVGDTGDCIVEFDSDTPALCIWQYMGQLGTMRVIIDDVELYRSGASLRNNTAQAGAATTITLDAGASAVNDFYRTRWIRTTGGTGVGQIRQIASYVGATKVATVNTAWAVNPDNTTTFEIAARRRDNNDSSGLPFVLFDFSGERRFRHYRVECEATGFNGVYVTSAVDTVMPGAPSLGTPTIWFGDSFSAGTGTDGDFSSLAGICCAELGWQLSSRSIGGTGYLNPATGASNTTWNIYDRLFPPVNAWYFWNRGATAGTFTLTQGATTTATIAYNASPATFQAALDTAFGAGQLLVVGTAGQMYWIKGVGGNASNAATMSVDFTGVTNGTKIFNRFLGDIAIHAPKDGSGNYLPFNIVLALGHNDTVSGGYTRAALVAAVSALIDAINNNYPQATVYVVGSMFLPGGSGGSDVSNANADILTGCTGHLKLINGKLPFIDTITVPWMTGTGYIGNTQNNGNSDLATFTDGIHPAPLGHYIYGKRIAQAIAEINAKQMVP